MNQKSAKLLIEKNIHFIASAIIVLGVLLRLVFYFQNRCLFIDEANLARNIFERNYFELFAPLKYEQYAPPIFLCIIKFFVSIFGYGEFSFRMYPLICGTISLYILFLILKNFNSKIALLYPLFLFATGSFFVRYSAELKQYIPDLTVTLLLLYASLKINIYETKPYRFFILWTILGSFGIWMSMPSVFILSGIGAYYIFNIVKNKKYTNLQPLLSVYFVWLVQFLCYYIIILKPQIQSNYLQNWHKDFFLNFKPHNIDELKHNKAILVNVIRTIGGEWNLDNPGDWTIPNIVHIFLFIFGLVYLLIKRTSLSILLFVPIFALVIAAGSNQYALTPRLILFILPMILICIGAGLDVIFNIEFIPLKLLFIIPALICVCIFGRFDRLFKRLNFEQVEQIKESLDFLIKEKVPGNHIFVQNNGGPAYIYYTTIHPDKDKRKDVLNATWLSWNGNYDSAAQAVTGTSALLYSWAPDDEIAEERKIFQKYSKEINGKVFTGSRAYIFEKLKK